MKVFSSQTMRPNATSRSIATLPYNEWMRQGWAMTLKWRVVEMQTMTILGYRLKVGLVVIIIMVLGFFNESQGKSFLFM
jgi:hypothetical protein